MALFRPAAPKQALLMAGERKKAINPVVGMLADGIRLDQLTESTV